MGADDVSNPLAPDYANPVPEKPKPKSNADFRKVRAPSKAQRLTILLFDKSMIRSDNRPFQPAQLLMTPRAVGGGGRGGNRGEFQRPKSKFKPKPRPKPVEDEPEGPTYRDRAKERREEANPDYVGDQALFPGAVPGKVPGYAPPGAQDELRQLSIEESKYLGGDMEHTHLVKGLDFALLRKVRAEMKEKEKDDAHAEREKIEHKVPGEKKIPGEKKSEPPKPEDDGRRFDEDGRELVFHSDMARNLHDWVIESSKVPDPKDVHPDFASGRLAYRFNLDDPDKPVEAFLKPESEAVRPPYVPPPKDLGPIVPNEKFASGRLAFRFDLDDPTDTVTTVMRPMSEPPSHGMFGPDYQFVSEKDKELLLDIAKIFKKHVDAGTWPIPDENSKGKDKKSKKKAAREAEAAAAAARARELAEEEERARKLAAPADSDEDIFGDTGKDYEPTVTAPTRSAGDGAGDEKASIFGEDEPHDGFSGRKTYKKEEAAADGPVIEDVYGLAGPLPAPPAPDFRSIDPWKEYYARYVAAGTVTREGAERWDPNAASEYLQTVPDFALAISAHSVKLQEREEAAEAAREKERGILTKEKVKLRPSGDKPMDASAAKAELERRAEMSLAADDGYGECYAGGFGDYGANAYESDDEADEKKKKEAADAADGGADAKGPKPGGKAGRAGPGAKGGKPDLKALERERDQKINSELGSLHKMMKEKYGDKVDVAFGEGKGGGEGGGGGKRAGEEEDGVGGGGGRKKRMKLSSAPGG